MKWLNELIAKINALSNEEVQLQQPAEKVADGEKVIGSLSEGLQRSFAYRSMLIDKMKSLKMAHMEDHKAAITSRKNDIEKKCSQFTDSMLRLEEEMKVVDTAFWVDVHEEIKSEVSTIGIRENWQVVEIPEEKTSGIVSIKVVSSMDILDMLMR